MKLIRNLPLLILPMLVVIAIAVNSANGSIIVDKALVNGHLVPLDQFHIGFPDNCSDFHYHAATSGAGVTAVDGTVIADPDPTSCGYGTVGSLPIGSVFVLDSNDDDFDGLSNDIEKTLGLKTNDPDSDNDSIFDGDEESDGDGLANKDEANVYGTNPKSADSDKNGVKDGAQIVLASNQGITIEMPVVVNYLFGATTTPEFGNESIEKANVVLGQIGVKLKVVKTNVLLENGGDDGSGGGEAGDGVLTKEERKKVFIDGGKEVAELPGKRGMKITFTADGGADAASVASGKSAHRYQVVIVEPRKTTDLTGATIAHEVGHAFTLKHPGETPEKNDDTADNIMREANKGRDKFVDSDDPKKGLENLKFTDEQKAEIQKDKMPEKWGNKAAAKSPSQKSPYQYGGVVDDLSDQDATAPDYADLGWIAMSSELNIDPIHTIIGMNDVLPSSGDIDLTYSLLFDTDANSATGATVDEFTGIEKELVIRLSGDASDLKSTIAAVIVDMTTFEKETLLPKPKLHDVEEESASSEAAVNTGHLIELEISKSDLDLTVDVPVPVYAMIRDTPDTFQSFTVYDSASLAFESRKYLADPTLTLFTQFAKSGDTISYEIEGLAPNDTFELTIDDTVIQSETLDAGGEFSGTFTLPDISVGVHFITAQDTSGEFAFNSIEVPNTFTISSSGVATVKEDGESVDKEIELNVGGEFECTTKDPTMVVNDLTGSITIDEDKHDLASIKVTVGKNKSQSIKIDAKIENGTASEKTSSSLSLAKAIDCDTPLNVAAITGKNILSATVNGTKYSSNKVTTSGALEFDAATNSLDPINGTLAISQSGTANLNKDAFGFTKGIHTVSAQLGANYTYSQAEGLDIDENSFTASVDIDDVSYTVAITKLTVSNDHKKISYAGTINSTPAGTLTGDVMFLTALDFGKDLSEDAVAKKNNLKAILGSGSSKATFDTKKTSTASIDLTV